MDTCTNCGHLMAWNPNRELFWCPVCRRHTAIVSPSEGEIALACARLHATWDDGREQARSGGVRRPIEVTRVKKQSDGLKRRRHE